MKLKELLEILPDNLDISIEHDGCKTSSSVRGIKHFDIMIEQEVINVEPLVFFSIGIQSFNIKINNYQNTSGLNKNVNIYDKEESQKDFMMRSGLDTRGIYGY